MRNTVYAVVPRGYKITEEDKRVLDRFSSKLDEIKALVERKISAQPEKFKGLPFISGRFNTIDGYILTICATDNVNIGFRRPGHKDVCDAIPLS